jgi:ethanolamine transporter EutH
MLAMTVFGATVGALLGSQFKMFVLGPAILLALSVTVAAGLIRGVDLHDIALAVSAILASLQFGYIAGGVAASFFTVRTKLSHRSWTPSQF